MYLAVFIGVCVVGSVLNRTLVNSGNGKWSYVLGFAVCCVLDIIQAFMKVHS